MAPEELKALRSRLDGRLNDWLCEMKPGYDDSIVGFNEAWDVMRKCLDDMRDDTVTPSCGCVFCDLDDVPEMINGALKHHYQGRDGRLVPCTKAV